MADANAIRELAAGMPALDVTMREVAAEVRRNIDETHDSTKNIVAIQGIMDRYDALQTDMSRAGLRDT